MAGQGSGRRCRVYVVRAVASPSSTAVWAGKLRGSGTNATLHVEPLRHHKYGAGIELSSATLVRLRSALDKLAVVRGIIKKAWGGADPDAIPADLKAMLPQGRVFRRSDESHTFKYPPLYALHPIYTSDWGYTDVVFVLGQASTNATPPTPLPTAVPAPVLPSSAPVGGSSSTAARPVALTVMQHTALKYKGIGVNTGAFNTRGTFEDDGLCQVQQQAKRLLFTVWSDSVPSACRMYASVHQMLQATARRLGKQCTAGGYVNGLPVAMHGKASLDAFLQRLPAATLYRRKRSFEYVEVREVREIVTASAVGLYCVLPAAASRQDPEETDPDLAAAMAASLAPAPAGVWAPPQPAPAAAAGGASSGGSGIACTVRHTLPFIERDTGLPKEYDPSRGHPQGGFREFKRSRPEVYGHVYVPGYSDAHAAALMAGEAKEAPTPHATAAVPAAVAAAPPGQSQAAPPPTPPKQADSSVQNLVDADGMTVVVPLAPSFARSSQGYGHIRLTHSALAEQVLTYKPHAATLEGMYGYCLAGGNKGDSFYRSVLLGAVARGVVSGDVDGLHTLTAVLDEVEMRTTLLQEGVDVQPPPLIKHHLTNAVLNPLAIQRAQQDAPPWSPANGFTWSLANHSVARDILTGLLNALYSNPTLDCALVGVARALTAAYLLKHGDEKLCEAQSLTQVLAAVQPGVTMEAHVMDKVLTMGVPPLPPALFALPMALGARVKVMVMPDASGRAFLYPPLSPPATIPVFQRGAPENGGLGPLLSHPTQDAPTVTVHLLRLKGTYCVALPALVKTRTALAALLSPAQVAGTSRSSALYPAPTKSQLQASFMQWGWHSDANPLPAPAPAPYVPTPRQGGGAARRAPGSLAGSLPTAGGRYAPARGRYAAPAPAPPVVGPPVSPAQVTDLYAAATSELWNAYRHQTSMWAVLRQFQARCRLPQRKPAGQTFSGFSAALREACVAAGGMA